MSREWRRVPSDTLCGYCRNRVIAKDEPACYTKLPLVKRERVRCQSCAGETVPDLPARIIIADIGQYVQDGFTKAALAAPERTRGALREAVGEWTPYAEAE